MEFNDLKLGTIIKQNASYSVVLGISDFPDYENRFAVKDAYNYIPIVVYRLVSFTLPENLSDNENALNAKRQVINNLLTVTMQEEIKADLMYTAYVVQVTKFDMKPRTKEIQTWLLKNNLFHPSVFDGIFDVEDRKKRLKEIIAKRDNYYKFLWTKLSCYDKMDKSLERNFEKLKFGEVYVSDGCFCICMGVVGNYFYCIERKGNLKNEITSFVLTCMPDEIMFGCRKMSPNLLYDTGVNIMTYWWNKENYEWIKEREKWQ